MPNRTDPFAPPGQTDPVASPPGVATDRPYQVVGIANRLRAVLLHVPYYSIEGNARLARDTGLAASTISRLARGKTSPSYIVVEIITRAISHRLGRSLDAREIFTTNGCYPTPSTCALLNCSGCLPPEAWQEGSDTLRPSWRSHRPGDWARYPVEPSDLESKEKVKPGEGSACMQVPASPEVYI